MDAYVPHVGNFRDLTHCSLWIEHDRRAVMYTVTVLDTLGADYGIFTENSSIHRCSFLLPVVQDTPSLLAYRSRHTFGHDGTVSETELLLIGIY